MEIPGIKACHRIITDECRQSRTDNGAFDFAQQDILAYYQNIVAARSDDKGVKYHLILCIEEAK